jgi:hypothetical protein
MNRKFLYLLFLGIALLSCTKKAEKQAEAEKIVTKWVGKTIQIPSDLQLSIYGKNTLLPGFHSTPYKILFFADSTGCIGCKLGLSDWKKLIVETDSTFVGKLSFIFCFQPKNKNDLVSSFLSGGFNYPVFIDQRNIVNKLNHFPDKPEYQCFLLDGKDKVISVGNPARNPKVWDLYKQIITGKRRIQDKENTKIEVINKEVKLGNIKKGVKRTMAFKLKNTGNRPLIISDVKTSCGCTNADWEKQPIITSKTTLIKAEITIEQVGYFEKTISVYCNVENSPIILNIRGNTQL